MPSNTEKDMHKKECMRKSVWVCDKGFVLSSRIKICEKIHTKLKFGVVYLPTLLQYPLSLYLSLSHALLCSPVLTHSFHNSALFVGY